MTDPVSHYIDPFCGSLAVWLNAPWWTLRTGPLFPYFGGKSTMADVVWQRFGAPATPPLATVNDEDGLLVNAWRAVQADPDGVARYADGLVIEANMHAAHLELVRMKPVLLDRLCASDYYDARLAGLWIKGACEWIGSGWCKGKGGWIAVPDDDGIPRMVRGKNDVDRKRPHLMGQSGVSRQLPHLSCLGRGVNSEVDGNVREFIRSFAARMPRCVRIMNGDWSRIVTPAVLTATGGVTGVFLDPPYGDAADRDPNLYSNDCLKVASDCRAWCIANGHNPRLRICLAGYDGEHNELEALGWSVHEWSTKGGYGNQAKANPNRHRERLWFSPHCLSAEAPPLLGLMEGPSR